MLCFAVSAAHATAPVGATPGAFAVSPSGAATYSVPIFVPPGTNGMQPQLSLNYNSQGGNGLVGMGWSIGGLSVIHRCGATIAIDGVKGGVNYDANDKLCLDGERLIWDATNGFYRTQHESWQKVSVVGGYFTVTTKDGTVMTYGGTDDSRILARGNPSIIRIWALNRIQSPSNNYLTISYNNQGNASGEYYPTSIAYTGNVNAGVSPYSAVYFEYGARTDIAPQYEGGSLISATQRLTRILTYTGSTTLVREYRLSYDNSGAVGRSRLTSIQECGTDGVCLPATTLGWQNGSVGFNTATQWIQHGASEPAQMQYADVNGDGKMDSLYFDTNRSNQVWIGISTGSAFAAPAPWVSYSSSTPAQIHYADVNGDGKADALYADTSGNRALVSLSTGSGFSAPAEWAAFGAYGTTLDPAQVQYADVNGDGRADLIHQGSNNGFRVGLSSGVGFGSLPLWVQHGGSFVPGQAQYADVNGDGRADLIFQATDNGFWVSLSTGASFTAPSSWVQHGGGFTAGQARYADVNGDGKADLVFQGNDGWLWISLSTGAGFTAPAAWAQPATSSRIIGSQVFTTVGPMSFTVPYGITSLKITVAGGGGGGSGGNDAVSWGAGGGGGGGYSQQLYGPVTPAQVINGFVGSGGPAGCWVWCDGIPGGDTVFGALIATGGGGGEFGDPWTGGYGGYPGGQQGQTQNQGGGGAAGAGQGAGGGPGQPGGLYGGGGGAWNESSSDDGGPGAQGWIKVEWDSSSYSQVQYADANGDGMADAVYLNMYDNSIWVYLSTGAGFLPGALWGQLGSGASLGSQMHYADVNGDGLPDALYFDTFQSNGVRVGTKNGAFPDLLTGVTNGLGAQHNIVYDPLTANGSGIYTKGGGAQYPYLDVQNATYVVQTHRESNGLGGSRSTRYWYHGLKYHHEAAAGLGFEQIQALTNPGFIYTFTNFNQSLDGTEGTIASSVTKYGNQTLKSLVNNWVPVPLGSGRTWVKLANTTEQSSDLNGASLPTITTTYVYDSPNSTIYAYGGSPTSVRVDFNDGWTKTTLNTYNNDTVNWQLGQLLQSQVTAGATRTSSFTYDSLGRLESETIEPNSGTLWLKSIYGYDAFGNRVKKAVSGPDITTRDEYVLTYDPRGQFVTTRKNALNHPESFTHDTRTGAVLTATDANNITTTYTYNDGFGRKTKESRPGSPTTDIHYECWDGSIPESGVKCPVTTSSAATLVRTVTSGGGTNYAFHDLLGRVVQTNTQGFGGNYTYKETQYDSLGRVSKVSHPYFGGGAVHCTTYRYDTLGRVRTVTEPGPTTTDCANTTGGRITTTTYNGLSTTVTNPLSQSKTTVKNSQGLVASVTDNAGTVNYQHDPFGNLLQVTGVDNAITSMTYDLRGRKIAMTDPDMGAWTYAYNVLGELVFQTDAKNQTITMAYDKLGRMRTRTTPDSTSIWNYDTAAYGKGKLAVVYNTNANESYTYDSLSRLSAHTIYIGGITYTTSHGYDAYSRPLTQTYPITGFKLYNVYDAYGHLTEVRKDTSTGLRYWKADTFDAHGRLTKETLGNNHISQRAYDPATGDLQTIKTGTAANPTWAQNLSYQFDALDNLTSRTDAIMGYTEAFYYDDLNRLSSVTGPAGKSYSYYPNGNIRFKSDVGVYNYNGPQPHAVSGVGGYVNTSYTYDANGNMLSGNGRTITYYSFNKPKTIVKGSTTDTFTYDANFNRLAKSNGSGTTTYIGKRYEKLVSGATTTQKHYIYAGNNLVGVSTVVNGGSPATSYFHTDHLGSVNVITNIYGIVNQRLSYDAFGKRRNPNGTDATGISAQTTRGFTRHEHDDEVGLINMNAREYDPVIGRFITPDTIIPGAMSSQAFNRYSYANNNPLSYTDPTGNWSLKKAVRKVVKAHKQFIDWHKRAADKAMENKYVRMGVAAVAAYYTFQWSQAAFLSTAAPTTAAGANAMYVASSVGAGYTSGYAAGGVMCGSDCARQGAKGGAVSGGVFAGADLMSQDWNAFGRVGSRATAGGLSNDLQGRSFSEGFRYNSLYYGAQEWTDSLAGKSGLTARDSDGKLRTDGTREPLFGAPKDASIFSGNRMYPEGSPLHKYEEIAGVRNLIVDVSKVHDTMNSFMYSGGYFAPTGNVILDSLADVYSFAGMLPAASSLSDLLISQKYRRHPALFVLSCAHETRRAQTGSWDAGSHPQDGR